MTNTEKTQTKVIKSEKLPKRKQTLGEEIANAVSHGVMVIFGIVGLVFMLIKQDSGRGLAGALIFGISILMLYLMSTLYHSLSATGARGIFKRFDHLSIFLLIGGTFAPALLLLPSLQAQVPFASLPWLDKGLLLFIIQWFFIVLGIIFKSIWVYKFKSFHFIIYLVLGWSAVFFIGELHTDSIPGFWYILGGGIAYTIGTVFYALSHKVKYFHFVWHLWVNIGTILHFIAIYYYIFNL